MKLIQLECNLKEFNASVLCRLMPSGARKMVMNLNRVKVKIDHNLEHEQETSNAIYYTP